MTNWPVKTLGEVCDVLDKLRKPITKRDRTSGDYPYYGATGIVDHVGDYIFDEPLVLVGEDGAKWGAGERTAFIAEGKYWVNNHAHVLRCKQGVLVDSWLANFLTMSDLNRYVSGLTVPKLNQGSLVSIEIPVPPIEEQKRIVALLDAATARVTELTACYEQARTHAKLLSGSLLVELLTSVVDSEPMRLGDIAELKGRIGWRGLTAKEYTKEGPLFVSVHSLNYGHFVDLKDAFHISQERYDESPEIMLKSKDILICKDGAGIGKLGMVGQLPGPATINSSLLLIRASKKVRSEFLYFYLLSPIFQNLVQERLSGSTTPHLYQRDIADLVIKLPSLETQDHLIEQMWSALGRQGDLVECFSKQIDAMIRMQQSMLEAAFAGDI
jgi:type I restriction enzyme S subunit